MAAQAEAKNRRRRTYIYKDFQRSFIIHFCMATFGAMMATSLVLLILYHMASVAPEKGLIQLLIGVNAIVLAALLLLTYLVALNLSHKIGGPLYRFEKSMDTIGEGNLTVEVNLRPDDQLHDLSGHLNTMVQNLNMRVSQMQVHISELRELSGQSECPEHIKGEIERLYKACHRQFEV